MALVVAVLQTSSTASSLAAVSVAGLVLRIVFGLLGGQLADRVSRRAILLGCDLARATVAAGLGLALLLTGPLPLWALVALVVPMSAASGAAGPTFSALVPDLVDEDQLVATTSLLASVSPLALMTAGPTLGGLLASYDVGIAFMADSATFVVSALCVLALRPRQKHAQLDGPTRASPWADFRAGLAYARTSPWLSTNLISGVVVSFAVAGSFTLLPLLVTDAYGAPTASFGYLLGLGGAAATVTSVVVASRGSRRRPLASSYVGYVVGLGAVAGLGVASDFWAAVPFVVLLFVGTTAGNIWQEIVLGSRVPRELRGRVAALDWVAATVSGPLSVTASAALTGVIGLRATFVTAGLLAAAACLMGLLLLLRSGEPVGSEEPAVDVVESA